MIHHTAVMYSRRREISVKSASALSFNPVYTHGRNQYESKNGKVFASYISFEGCCGN